MSTKNAKKAERKLPARDAAPESPGGKFWTVRIGPMEIIPVADNMAPCQVVIKNHGPGIVGVCTGFHEEWNLMPGHFRLMSAGSRLTVESREDKSALREMEFLPASK
jgi:hypothetical protein